MIVVDLVCTETHRFEGWFASSEAFEAQYAQKMVSCPMCGTHVVQRLPSAPHIGHNSAAASAPEIEQADPARILAKLINVLRDQAISSEDVGKRFAEEARKIHYGDAEARTIRGQASLDETRGLLEEGISVLTLPPTKEDLH
ncbi:DUF1178 family protein [Uliginosibacterium flavum]|uniref:DUF1178 family protein n=1 Tax=Uliginosibacterium flavum TaxID=1396831 RepID=A0ABV2TQX4_9RHOO